MNDIAAPAVWLEANQRYLTAELGRIRALLENAATDSAHGVLEAQDAVADAREALPEEAAIDTLAATFALTSFERDVLLLAAGVEMDARIAALCAAANRQPSAAFATFGLAMAVLPDAHWSALIPDRPLRRFRLVDVGTTRSLTTGPLRIEERVLHYLAGTNALDMRLRPVVRERIPGPCPVTSHRQTAALIADACRRTTGEWPIVQLWGDDAEAQSDVAAHAAAALGLSVHVMRGDDVPAVTDDRWALGTLWSREARLLGSALLLQNVAGADRRAVADFVETLGPPLFVATREPIELLVPSRSFEVTKPDAAERARLWRIALGPLTDELEDVLDIVAGQYRLGAGVIGRLAAAVRNQASAGTDSRAALTSNCRSQATHDLDGLAHRIEPIAGWTDLVLPTDVVDTLREIVAQVRHRATVYGAWGFGYRSARGLGITALFAGASGTGKTMAAEVLAGELGLALYRIDLSTVVSKYIGETEKNLRRVFDTAEDSGAILLFDEADALFGKRSEVRDSHDRYANIETSYLLQRMEEYRGLAVLATNMKGALDSAFLRRIRFVVQFPFPDYANRREIWQRVFPDEMPREEVDFARLARLNISGGNIRNIAMNAAFVAAECGEAVKMSHLLRAARSEYAKAGRALTDAEVAGWSA